MTTRIPATVQPADHPDRRAVLATAGAAAILAAIGMPAVAMADPDAPLWALRLKWLQARAAINAVTDKLIPDGDEREARLQQACSLEDAVIDEVATLPARTLAGLGFKVEASRAYEHMSPELVASIMADVAAFAGSHPSLRI